MEVLLYIAVSILSAYLLLAMGNQPYGQRWKQYWAPLIGFFVALLAIYEYYSDFYYLIGPNSPLFNIFGYYVVEMYSLLVIGAFSIIKLSVNEGGRLFSKKTNQPLPRFSVAYKTDDKGGIVIKKEWVFGGLFAKYLAWIAFGLFLLLLLLKILQVHFGYQIIDTKYLSTPFAFAIFLILEMHWYLRHPRIEEQPEAPTAQPEKTTVPNDFFNLWLEYQKIWEDKKLIAWTFKPPKEKAHQPESLEIIEASNLVSAGFTLTLNDYDILVNLVNQKDMLIDDMVHDEVAPLLFSVFLRRLMDGENILVLTARRCYPNSKYHQQIVDWINQWIFRLTSNREFFKVHTFSRLEDVEFTSRIIVTSADDILEKNIIGHNWFNSLKTILFLSGDEVFSESLTSNNILLNILRSRYRTIQCVVLADYRESLQSSVMHNLEASTNLREVRMRHNLPENIFLLFWKLEGNTLFQHKVLLGHIEKYLGAEAVLALIARRESITDIRVANQEGLPYYEYLEETDNNTGTLNPTIVAPRTLRLKGINEVKSSEVNGLMAVGENTFILLRDNEFNMVTALRKWQVFARQNLFLHIVCPPYMLRDYFAFHLDYFWRTPLYALSSKLMTSRFEVARKLLEQMVVYELTENEILQSLFWINANAVFVKQELRNLFRLAFDIDIVTTNYLSVRSDAIYDRELNSFKQVTFYKLLPQIKSELNLAFLRKVEIVRAGETLEVTSLDLLFQNYLPDQIHAFGGKSYAIKGFDYINGRLQANYDTPTPVVAYRPDVEVLLTRLDPPLNDAQRKVLLKKITLELSEGSFEISTQGYTTFKSDISLQPNDYTYTQITETQVPVRNYPLGRVMVLRMEAPQTADIAKLTATFTVLLTELMPTLFPETFNYILIGSPLNQSVFKGVFDRLFPTIKVHNDEPAIVHKVIELCIFEDAHQDLGLVQSIFDNWDYILRILDDYLVWLLDKPQQTAPPRLFSLNPETDANSNMFQKAKIEKEKFLKYGLDKLPDFLDFQGATDLLRSVLGNNYMTSQRSAFYNGKS